MLNSQIQVTGHQDHASRWTGPIISFIAIAFIGWFLSTGVSQLVVAVLFISIGAVLIFLRPNIAIIATMIYLAFMGDIRRVVSTEAGVTSQDPLLLVGPIMAGLLFAKLLFERRIEPDTPVAKLVLALMVVMTLEIINPLQGGLTVGLAGAMYYMVPLLWFWVARSTPSEKLTRDLLLYGVPLVAAAAAGLGMFQTYRGWLPFEEKWIEVQAKYFQALVVDGHIVRPFGFFSSPAEYAGYLSIGVVCCVAPLVASKLRWTLILLPLIGASLLIASVRMAIVLAALGVVVMWAMRGRTTQAIVGRGVLALILGGAGMVIGLRGLGHLGVSGRAGDLLDHTIEGILHPGESTAEGHGEIALLGIRAGFVNPIGEGLGSTTIAAGREGGHGSGTGYENDVADMFAGLGAIGGLIYLVTMGFILRAVFLVWTERRSLAALTVMGVLIARLGYWLEGGHYSTAALTWLLIGSIDRNTVPQITAAVAQRFIPPVIRHAHPAHHA